MKKIVFASNNDGKIKEIREILKDFDAEILTMKEAGAHIEIEENGTTFEENALIKARAVMQITGEITMADDSGLEIDYLNGEPGVYSARYMGHDTSYDIKNNAIIERMKNVSGNDRSARFAVQLLRYFLMEKNLLKKALLEGVIGEKPIWERTDFRI